MNFAQIPQLPLESLVAALERAKRAEDIARAERVSIEQAICSQMDLPREGTSHVEAGHWKVTVTSKLNRSLDEAKLRAIAHQIPDDVGAKVIRWKPEIVVKELRAVMEYRPDVYAILSTALTVTEAKPSVKVQILDEEAA
jgi:DNA/RNA endonuclease G (NUC1)